jgi:hypothetical protein
MRNEYAELQVFVPGKGRITLWRGRTYRQALTQRANRGLRLFKGRKVSVVESVCTFAKPLGWLEVKHG